MCLRPNASQFRVLKKVIVLTHPIPAATSPAHPESAKTASSPRDAPYPMIPCKAAANYCLIRGGWDDPNCARPTRVFLGRALREHGDRPSYPAHFFSTLLCR
jgi:hypothetical protein